MRRGDALAVAEVPTASGLVLLPTWRDGRRRRGGHERPRESNAASGR